MKKKSMNNNKGLINPENASLIIPVLSGFLISLLISIFGIAPKILLINITRDNIELLNETYNLGLE